MNQLYTRLPFLLIVITAPALLSACDQNGTEHSGLHIPGPEFKPDAKTGKRLFSTNCSKCHGTDAKGTDKGPPLVDKTYRPGHHGDMVFHFAVSRGAKQHHRHFGDMPAVPNLSPEDVGHIIFFVRSEQRNAGIK